MKNVSVHLYPQFFETLKQKSNAKLKALTRWGLTLTEPFKIR